MTLTQEAKRSGRNEPTARELLDMQQSLIDSGLNSTIVLAWSWLYEQSDFGGRLIIVSQTELAAAVRRNQTSAGNYVRTMTDVGLLRVVNVREGHGGGTEVEVRDPCEVLGRPKTVRPSAQREFRDEAGSWREEEDRDRPPNYQFSVQKTDSWEHDAEVPPADERGERHVVTDRTTGDAAAEVDPPMPADLAALRQQIGADRFDLWLGRCHSRVEDGVLQVTPELHVLYTRLTSEKRRSDLQELRQAAREACDLGLRLVEPEPPPTIGLHQFSGQKTVQKTVQKTDSCPAIRQELSSEPVLEGSEERQDKKTLRAEQLVKASQDLFERIADQDLYPWLCHLAYYAIHKRWINHGQLEQMFVDARDGRWLFGKSLHRAIGNHRWPKLGKFKQRLFAEFGIVWQREWEVPLSKRELRRKSR